MKSVSPKFVPVFMNRGAKGTEAGETVGGPIQRLRRSLPMTGGASEATDGNRTGKVACAMPSETPLRGTIPGA